MNRAFLHRLFGVVLALGLVLLPGALQACATCYGASDSPMARGMNWGIMSLLVVVALVLGGFVAFFIYLCRRAAAHAAGAAAEPVSSQN